MVDWPTPINVTQLRSLLGLTGYYRRFIKNDGIICKPLYEALKKKGFCWTASQEQAFADLKQIMTQAPVLALPNFDEPFILETDASGLGIGTVLMQGGRPISFMSKAIGPKAAAYSIYDKEALAILESLKRWKHYLLSSSVIIRTDQQSLKYIAEQRLTEGIQHKLLIKLLGFQYRIEYRKGKENRAVDALSRRPQVEKLAPISVAVPGWITEVLKS
uniref:Reverse transcriptase/retrotransposon-derived protein RNase H-like domain-containing protein n=1 Tax=Arundo donax TaxID=35708 RepID=A0A0A9HJE1_ARUDO